MRIIVPLQGIVQGRGGLFLGSAIPCALFYFLQLYLKRNRSNPPASSPPPSPSEDGLQRSLSRSHLSSRVSAAPASLSSRAGGVVKGADNPYYASFIFTPRLPSDVSAAVLCSRAHNLTIKIRSPLRRRHSPSSPSSFLFTLLGFSGSFSSNCSKKEEMGQQSLIYSFVARGTVVLAEYTEFTGNFTTVAVQCLQKLPSSSNKFTYTCDGHTFNYLVDNGFGIGYNGFPRGCSDDKLPWSKKSESGDPLQTKYPYVCHAEVNAILNRNHASAAGQKLYVTMFPCNECAKIIIQSGVSEVIYYVEKRIDNADACYAASHKLLSMAGIKVRKHQPQMNRILIEFTEL